MRTPRPRNPKPGPKILGGTRGGGDAFRSPPRSPYLFGFATEVPPRATASPVSGFGEGPKCRWADRRHRTSPCAEDTSAGAHDASSPACERKNGPGALPRVPSMRTPSRSSSTRSVPRTNAQPPLVPPVRGPGTTSTRGRSLGYADQQRFGPCLLRHGTPNGTPHQGQSPNAGGLRSKTGATPRTLADVRRRTGVGAPGEGASQGFSANKKQSTPLIYGERPGRRFECGVCEEDHDEEGRRRDHAWGIRARGAPRSGACVVGEPSRRALGGLGEREPRAPARQTAESSQNPRANSPGAPERDA